MMNQDTTCDGPVARSLQIEGEMTIYRAAELKDVLLVPLAGGAHLDVDLSGVSELDSAGVQLLMAAKAEAAARHGTLRLTGHSPAVLEVFELLDLAGHFGDPLLMPAPASRPNL